MECIVCSTSLFHLSHEPMNMGCKCKEKICQRCVKTGEVHKCPTCRREKSVPKVDRRWLRRSQNSVLRMECLGCEKSVVTRLLHSHEMKCVKYRDLIDMNMEEDARIHRVQANQHSQIMTEMETRAEIQNEVMDQMEVQLDELDALVTHQETERKAYSNEQARILQTMDSLASPLYNAIRNLDRLYTKISSARASLRASTARHHARHQRTLEETTQVSMTARAEEQQGEENEDETSLEPPHHYLLPQQLPLEE